jgi:hypothetical protein
LPQHGKGIPAGGVLGLQIMIQLRMRVLPTTLHLARIQAVPKRFLHYFHACGEDVPKSV